MANLVNTLIVSVIFLAASMGLLAAYVLIIIGVSYRLDDPSTMYMIAAVTLLILGTLWIWKGLPWFQRKYKL